MDEKKLLDVIANKRNKVGKISIATLEGYSMVELDTVLYLESQNTYTNFFLTDGTKILSTKNIGFFEEVLLDEPFLRIHNSCIVNLSKVTKYVKADEGYVILTTGKPIKVSRSKRDSLLTFFQSVR